MMFGALIKAYSNELLGVPAGKVYLTSVMPCVRKRGESDHIAFSHDGVRDVDNVITTKDLGQLLRMKGIDPGKLEPSDFDSPFDADGTGTGAGQLFGATGGVAEAASRTVYELVTGEKLDRLELSEARGLDGVKEVTLQLGAVEGMPSELRVAVVNGLGNAKALIKKMREGEVQYDFVEVMACPGGCIAGGGQPKGEKGAVERRLECIYDLDRSLPRRRSHENPTVQAFYDEKYLGNYGSERAHELLHVEPLYGESPKLNTEASDHHCP
jgi:NADP-reducing hydrogenase subunit HndD